MKSLQSMLMASLYPALLLCNAHAETTVSEDRQTTGEPLGWRLGTQAWTFMRFTLFETIDKAHALGLKYIELFPGQKLDAAGDAALHHDMEEAARQRVLDKLNAAGIHAEAYGVVNADTQEEWRRIFRFAQATGMTTINTEPDPKFMDFIEALAEEFNIRVGIHNHPKPSYYWNPDTVLNLVEGHSSLIGSCADTGHWKRSGLSPIECLRKLDGRVASVHLKDINEAEHPHDVPWGTGTCNLYGILVELKRQGYRGLFSIEYEHNWLNSMPEIGQSIDYFQLVRAALDDEGYRPLFQQDLSNAIYPQGAWSLENGVLTARGGGDIWTKEQYGDFALDLEFLCEPQTNSGVLLRCGNIDEWLHNAIEVQILQPRADEPKHDCGGIFDCLAPAKRMVKASGQWNQYTIIARGSNLFVMLNDEQVVNMNLDRWTKPRKNPDGSPNKFDKACKDMPRAGHIGLQYHDSPIRFRNIRVKALEALDKT